MAQTTGVTCQVPIRVRLLGSPGDDDLARLEAAVARTVADRLRTAAQLQVRQDPTGAGGLLTSGAAAPLRSPPAPAGRGDPTAQRAPIPAADRQRVERAVAAGVQRALTAVPVAAGPPTLSPDPAGPSDLPSLEYESYEQIIAAIRAAFPVRRSGVLPGVYGTLAGKPGPVLWYLRPVAEGEGLDNISIYREVYDRSQRPLPRQSRTPQRVPFGLGPGCYTLINRTNDAVGELFREGVLLSRLTNRGNLNVTVEFLVDPLYAARPQPPPWSLVPRVRLVVLNPVSPLAVDAQSIYEAYTEIWRVDEYGLPKSLEPLAYITMPLDYRWEIVKHSGDSKALAEVVGHERILRHTWKQPGDYEVRCSVTARGTDVSDRPVSDSYKEKVIPRGILMTVTLNELEARQVAWERQQQPGSWFTRLLSLADPAEQIWSRSGVELLMKLEDELEAECSKKGDERRPAKIDFLKDAIERLRDQLYPTDRPPPETFAIHAVFMEAKTSAARPVSLFLAFTKKDEVDPKHYKVMPHQCYLIDLTYPKFYRTYKGFGQTPFEALLAAFKDSEDSVRRTYPPGQILARVTAEDLQRNGIEVPPGFGYKDFQFNTSSRSKDAYEWAMLAVQVVGLLALPAPFFFPALAPLLVVVGTAGAVLSAANILDRVEHNDFAWDLETFTDLANIIAAPLQVAGAAAGRVTSKLLQALDSAETVAPKLAASLARYLKVQQVVHIGGLGLQGTNGLILAVETWRQIKLVEEVEFDDESKKVYQRQYGDEEGARRWEEARQARITDICARAVFSGSLVLVSVASDVRGLKTLSKVRESFEQRGVELPPELLPASTQTEEPSGRPPAEPAAPGTPRRWNSLKELEQASASDLQAADSYDRYQKASDLQLVAQAAQGDQVARDILQQRAPSRPLDRFFRLLARKAELSSEEIGGRALPLLPPEQAAELQRLAGLLDLPPNATVRELNAAARANGVPRELDRLADWLSLTRRIQWMAESGGGVTREMHNTLGKLMQTGWRRGQLEWLLKGIRSERLAEWSRALDQHPDQIGQLGLDGLKFLGSLPEGRLNNWSDVLKLLSANQVGKLGTKGVLALAELAGGRLTELARVFTLRPEQIGLVGAHELEVFANLPEGRLTQWSEALARPDAERLSRLGPRALELLARSPRALALVEQGGSDAFIGAYRRVNGDRFAVERLLEGLELRRAELGADEYLKLRNRMAAGEPRALQEAARQVTAAAGEAVERLRSRGARALLEDLQGADDHIRRLREEGRTAEAASVSAARELEYIRLAALSPKELSGLERLADMGDIEWGSFVELAPADRAVLLPLVDDVLGGLPRGKLRGVEDVLALFSRQAGMAGQLDFTVQGSWGELYAARMLIRMGATELAFQVPGPGRRMDIVAKMPGRGWVSAEVKTYLDQAGIVEQQVRRDLVAHAPTGYEDLMYLYHENARGQLERLRQEMLALFDQPELQGLLRAAKIDPAKAKADFQLWQGLQVYSTE